MTTFKQLGLSSAVLKALSELGFEKPTDIQEQSIPHLLNQTNDFIGLAQTGTGKTAAYGLPLLERMDPANKSTQALILAPTRELGQQIAGQLEQFSKYQSKVSVLAIYGGASISGQMKALRNNPQVIIATAGRLIDMIKRKAVKLDQLQYLILDEADEMLNMGFKEDIDKILSYAPQKRQTWLFSATMPAEIRRIVNQYMNDPVEVRINPENEVNANIEHQFVVVNRNDKTAALTRFLDTQPEMRGLVFCRTKRETQKLAEELMKNKYRADALHGDMSQPQRDRVMKRFKQHDLHVLVATDVAARGIDVNDLTHVFHHSLPDDNSYYTHRSGRTARAGKTGISIAFIGGRDQGNLRKLEKQLGISFSKIMIPNAVDIAQIRLENWSTQILNSNGKVKPELLQQAVTAFKDISKEELISKLLQHELKQLPSGDGNDLNAAPQNHKKDRKRKQRKEIRQNNGPNDRKRNSNNGKPRFFINIGARDSVNKQDLMKFICDTAKVSHSDIGMVDVHKSHSFFEVNAKATKKVSHRFKGFVLGDGRELRVNRDN